MKKKKPPITNIGENWKKKKFYIYYWWRCKLVQPLQRTI
jgi:hypothetical protein